MVEKGAGFAHNEFEPTREIGCNVPYSLSSEVGSYALDSKTPGCSTDSASSAALVVLSILVLAVLGHMPESQVGWLTCPPRVVMVLGGHRPLGRAEPGGAAERRGG